MSSPLTVNSTQNSSIGPNYFGCHMNGLRSNADYRYALYGRLNCTQQPIPRLLSERVLRYQKLIREEDEMREQDPLKNHPAEFDCEKTENLPSFLDDQRQLRGKEQSDKIEQYPKVKALTCEFLVLRPSAEEDVLNLNSTGPELDHRVLAKFFPEPSAQRSESLDEDIGRPDQPHADSYKGEPAYQKTAVAAGSGFGIIAVLGMIGIVFRKYIGGFLTKTSQEKKPVEEGKELLPLDLRKEGKSLV